MDATATAAIDNSNQVDSEETTETTEETSEAALETTEPKKRGRKPKLVQPEVVVDEAHIGDTTILRKEIVELVTAIEQCNFKLAQKLYVVFAAQVWKKWGYNSWDDYTQNELVISSDRVRLLLSVWNWYTKNFNDPTILEEIASMGWTKAMMLATSGVCNKSNYQEWFPIAKEKQSHLLQQSIKETKVKDKDTGEPSDKHDLNIQHAFTVKLRKDELDVVEQACTRAGEISKAEKKGQQLAFVCQDYLATDQLGSKGQAGLADCLVRIENLVPGIKLIAINDKTSQVVYGNEFMGKLDGSAAEESAS